MTLEFKLGRDNVLLNAIAAGADNTPTGFCDVNKMRSCSLHVVWTGLTGTVNATAKLQESNDGAHWVDIPSASVTLSGANGSDMARVANLTGEMVRAVYTHGTTTGGAVSAYLHTKG